MTFTHIHASGKWSTSTRRWVAHIRTLTRAADLITATEAQRPGLPKAISKALGPGWGVSRSGEFLWVWRKATLTSGKARPVKQVTHVKGFPKWRQTRVGVRWFHHSPSGRTIRSLVTHLPAGVEYGRSWRKGGGQTAKAVAAHKAATGWLGETIATITRTHPEVVQVLTLDANVDYRVAEWRTMMNRRVGLPAIWTTRTARTGSHGVRLIDAIHTSTEAEGVRVLAKADGFDHRPVTATLELTAPTKPTEGTAMLPANLPTLLRGEGLRVVTHAGWRDRGRPGAFAPVGVLCHHTATRPSTPDGNVIRLLIGGRSDLPGPLAQVGLARDGTVHLIAAGRANHAGKAKASGTVAAGDGNRLYIGIEAFNDGRGEPWPRVQYDAYVRLAAALTKHVTGNSVQTVRGHKETSVTGKIDPTFDMNRFREDVGLALNPPKPKPKGPLTRGGNVDHALADIRRAHKWAPKGTRRRKALDAATKALQSLPQTRKKDK